MFKTVSKSEIDVSPMPSEYIRNVLRRKLSHDPTFGDYQVDRGGSFKIERSKFLYNDKHVFVYSGNYTTAQGLWALLKKSKYDKNEVTSQDRQAYKQTPLQSNAHSVNCSTTGKIKQRIL
jgi:hypothetical protein